MKPRSIFALSVVCAALLGAVPAAHGEIAYQSSFGSEGGGAGQFSKPASIAINNGTGDLYIADNGGNRVEQFTENGDFVRAWGYDVVSSGADDKPLVDEVDAVKIRATAGTFRLVYGEEATGPIAYNASAATVETALNGLSTISAGGGSVSVTGGVGDPTGSSPYVVAFDGGPLKETDVQLEIDARQLALPPATQLTCKQTGFLYGATGITYRWLANGELVAGATSSTFTPGPGEAGKAIQCEMAASYKDGNQLLGATQPYKIAAGSSTTAPPLAPSQFGSFPPLPSLESGVKLKVGESTGAKLTCDATTQWGGSPSSYTYRWYRNGIEIGSPITTSATSSTYNLTADDAAEQAAFQCSILATNPGGSTVAFSGQTSTEPAPQATYVPVGTVEIPPTRSSRVVTQTNGGAQFEICQANPPSTDVCKAGAAGLGFGEFNGPRSIAVDNSPGGDGAVYVHDERNFRVQKFSSDGQPILAFGKEVDESSDGDVCTAASGDACGRGAPARDEAPGSIGSIEPYSFGDRYHEYDEFGDQLAVDHAGHVYLAEPRRTENDTGSHLSCPNKLCGPRIQKWNSDGTFLSFAKLKTHYPEERVGEREELFKPVSIGVDSNETVYATLTFPPNGVERVYADEFTPAGGKTIPVGNIFLPQGEARQVAIDPRNDRPLFSDSNEKEHFGSSEGTSVCGGPREPGRGVIELDVRMNVIDCSVPLGDGNLPELSGMAVGPNGKLYAAAGNLNVIKVFGLPVPKAPVISDEAAKKTTTQTSELHAQINPGFEETSYRVEYGLEDCAVSTCATAEGPEKLGGLDFASAVVKIKGLQPNTTYHYRFIAENVVGEEIGEDKTFTTYALVDLVNDPCPNALARKQTQAGGLLDCRAYELASAEWTGGYDVVSNIIPGETPFDGYPDAPDSVLYGVKDGGIPGTGNPTNRGIDPYVAERDEAGRWRTRYVGIESDNPNASGPFSSALLAAAADLKTFVFGGPDICSPCFPDGSSGMPVRLPSGELVQGMAGPQAHPNAIEAGHVASPLSADGKHLVFGSTSAFVPQATEGQATLYERDLTASGPNTEVISTRSDGSTMTGDVGELAISADGSRVVVAERVGTDAGGNPLWHPYLHIHGTADSVDLTDGPTSGVHFDGMTADGSTIFMSTDDQLPVDQPTQDEDESTDIYRAQVDEAGDLTLELVTVESDGSVSNDDGCEPPGEPTQWNAIEGQEGKCSAVPFAGGAGVAADDGTFYFVSPEELEPGKGIQNQPNLYVVRPGGSPAPHFVSLLDNSLEKPGPLSPQRPLISQEFGDAAFKIPGELAVDQSNQDVYALEVGFGEGNLYRYHANGTPHNFTAGPGAGTNHFEVSFTELGSWNQMAVDNSPVSAGGLLENAVYMPLSSGVRVFAQSGEALGLLTGAGTSVGFFGRACGVAIDQSSGAVYVADHNGYIWQYTPNGPAGAIDDSDYTVKGIATTGVSPCAIAADKLGNVYAAQQTEPFSTPGKVYRWSAGSFAASPPGVAGTEVAPRGTALTTDPNTDDLYVDAGKEINVLDSSGNVLEEEIGLTGPGKLNCPADYTTYSSRGVAINATTNHLYASCFDTLFGGLIGTVREWGYELPNYEPIDNPAIVSGVHHPEVHSWGDFQVTPDGAYAAFSTVVPLKTGFDNGGRYELYRYSGGGSDELLCVSCDPTGSQASTDSVLPPNGLGLLSDGRLFFNTGEALTLSDTNEHLDAYEWSPKRSAPGGCALAAGCQQLISTGTSSHLSGLLGVSADGKDAFFFTRDVLVPEDKNGQAMKIYDARELGGHFVIPPAPPCAASDECHGPGTQAQAAPQIGSYKGTGGQFKPSCRKGTKRKNGRCVHNNPRRKHRRQHKHRKAAGRHLHRAGRGGTR
jgi:hypothetical protein